MHATPQQALVTGPPLLLWIVHCTALNISWLLIGCCWALLTPQSPVSSLPKFAKQTVRDCDLDRTGWVTLAGNGTGLARQVNTKLKANEEKNWWNQGKYVTRHTALVTPLIYETKRNIFKV